VVTLDRRIRQLESQFNVDDSSGASSLMSAPVSADDLAVLESLEHVRQEYPDLDFREALEVAVARGLESRGYTTAQVAEALPAWIEQLEPSAAGGG
jgi:hypothetical protein